jgi:UDP-N-acetylglucosamine transferase subunit ALG13
LLLREPCDYASAIVSHRFGIPTAQVAISPGTADWDGLHLAAEVLEPIEPGVVETVEQAPYLSRFPHIDTPFPDCRAYGFTVGLDHREVQVPPLLWITFGTVNSAFDAQAGTWQAVLRAVEDLPVEVVASVGRSGPSFASSGNTSIVDWIELPQVLAKASLVVCHGGSGTTLAALSAGVPLVVIPLLADQLTNATMVEELGAGVAVRSNSDGPLRGLTLSDTARVRAAINNVLLDDTYSAAARRAAGELAGRPTVSESMDRLREQFQ